MFPNVPALAVITLSTSSPPSKPAYVPEALHKTSSGHAGQSLGLTMLRGVLVLEQALCEGALPAVCGAYVEDTLGAEFMLPPPWTLIDVFPATSPRTPTIFILSPGADPTAELQRFAEANGRVAGELPLAHRMFSFTAILPHTSLLHPNPEF